MLVRLGLIAASAVLGEVCVPTCKDIGDPYISRIPYGSEESACYSHLKFVGPDISLRADPVVWPPTQKNSTLQCNSTLKSAPCAAAPKEPSHAMTAEELHFYNTHGWIKFEKLMDAEVMDEARGLIDQALSQINRTNTTGLVGETHMEHELGPMDFAYVLESKCATCSDQVVKSIYDDDKSVSASVKDRLHHSPKIVRKVEQLLGGKVYGQQSRINFQQPGGKGFNWHSDFETWHNEDGLEKPRCLSAVVLFDRMTTFNGPLMFIQGSHKFYAHSRLKGHHSSDNYETSLENQVYGSPPMEQIDFLYSQGKKQFGDAIETVTGGKGDVLFFDCNTMHGSTNNMSPIGRTTLFMVFNSVHNPQEDVPYANKCAKVRPDYFRGVSEVIM